MKKAIITLLALVSIVSADTYCRQTTEGWSRPKAIPSYVSGYPQNFNHRPASEWFAAGFLPFRGEPDISTNDIPLGGYTRTRIGDEIWSVPNIITNTVAYEAAQAAIAETQQAAFDSAEAERRDTPEPIDHPLEFRPGAYMIVPATVGSNVAYRIVVRDDGSIVSALEHASPRKTKAERDAWDAADELAHGQAKRDWRNNSGKGQIRKRVEALEAAVNRMMGTGDTE